MGGLAVEETESDLLNAPRADTGKGRVCEFDGKTMELIAAGHGFEKWLCNTGCHQVVGVDTDIELAEIYAAMPIPLHVHFQLDRGLPYKRHADPCSVNTACGCRKR